MTRLESFAMFSPVILLMAVLLVALWLGRAKRNRRVKWPHVGQSHSSYWSSARRIEQ